jgi:Txe/YoeB family toxin of toxin-antitoxin system
VSYKLVYTKQARKDSRKIKACGLEKNVKKLLEVIRQNPYQTPPPCEKLVGDFTGAYSRRINIQHRLVYVVIESEKTIQVLRMFSHYE